MARNPDMESINSWQPKALKDQILGALRPGETLADFCRKAFVRELKKRGHKVASIPEVTQGRPKGSKSMKLSKSAKRAINDSLGFHDARINLTISISENQEAYDWCVENYGSKKPNSRRSEEAHWQVDDPTPLIEEGIVDQEAWDEFHAVKES